MVILNDIIFAAVLFLTTLRLRQQNRPTAAVNFYIGGSCLVFFLGEHVNAPLGVISQNLPFVYDPVIHQIEILTGLSHPALNSACLVLFNTAHAACVYAYGSLPLLVILFFSLEITRAQFTLGDNLLVRFTIGAALAPLLYTLMPAIGAAFYSLPTPNPPELAQATYFPDHGAIARNAMPSLHATWSLLCFLSMRRAGRWPRWLGGAFVALTFITTIGCRVHYLADWLAALPLVLLIRALTAHRAPIHQRTLFAASGAALIGGWVLAIRLAPGSLTHPDLLRLLVVLSVVVPVLLEARLARTEQTQATRAHLRAPSPASPAARQRAGTESSAATW